MRRVANVERSADTATYQGTWRCYSVQVGALLFGAVFAAVAALTNAPSVRAPLSVVAVALLGAAMVLILASRRTFAVLEGSALRYRNLLTRERVVSTADIDSVSIDDRWWTYLNHNISEGTPLASPVLVVRRATGRRLVISATAPLLSTEALAAWAARNKVTIG